ncbi:hypothetical protein CHS0354_025219 [Potamilus streckersoni]|uniref:DUF7042 domain-containing protein n=1 Tax=Potamilus streckersoni TaxID=2493646 RepID=A0AAE0RN13_9BIVA|nr:hypothetical protein CHS0354_025219 [Potamilus streckersoni]
MVYNNDSTVNGVETRRFSCFAISNDGKNATMVPNNCTEKQTPYEFPKSPNQSDTGAKLYLSAYASCRETSVCSFPDSFKNTVWQDSTKGNLTFTNSSMSGWYIKVFGQSIINWECYDSSYFATYGYLVFRSKDTISSSSQYYAYLCMRLTRVTDYSYYYYLLQAQVYNAGQERVYLSTDYSVSNFSLICDTRNVEPLEQFHMLIRSDRGIVWCVAAVSGTYTYVMVYNNDSVVDQNTTHRFSCLTVSSNGTSASHVPRNCTQNQTPDTFAISNTGTNTGYKAALNARGEESKCNFPNNFKNSVWHDSTKGDLQFTNTSMHGWSTTVFGQTVRNWECLNSTLFDSEGYLIFRLTDTISWNVPYYAYMCMKLTQVTDYSYYYYLVRGQEFTAGQERILVSSNGSITDFTSLCVLGDIAPAEEFHVLIKSGFESSAKRDCPNVIRGNFDYEYYGSDGSTYCSSSNDQWTVCRDNTTMTFNYTTCNKTMAYSSGGNVWCVASVNSGYTYLIVYNNDTHVDDVDTFRFTCFAISTDGKNASVSPRNCSKGQTPYAFAKGSSGSNVGAKLTMTSYQTCAAESTAVNLPIEIRNSLWYDGTKGNITFSDKGMSGWGLTVFGHTVSNWEFIGNYFDLSGYWIFR